MNPATDCMASVRLARRLREMGDHAGAADALRIAIGFSNALPSSNPRRRQVRSDLFRAFNHMRRHAPADARQS